jgi:hypothetical protein
MHPDKNPRIANGTIAVPTRLKFEERSVCILIGSL